MSADYCMGLTQLFQERGAFGLTGHHIPRDKFAPLIHYQATQGIGYALVDENLQIVLTNEWFKSWSDKQIRNITGLVLTEVFPELVGTEQNLVNLLHHSQKVIHFRRFIAHRWMNSAVILICVLNLL